MKTFTISWLNKCRCGNKSHTVKTGRGNETAFWDDDAVKCNSCGRGGVIQVCEGQARVLWETDEEMAEGKPMSTITKEQAKDLRNAFHCWQQDYDPVEDKEQYDMFGLGMVAMDALLASLEAEPVAWAHRLINKRNGVVHPWVYGSAEACPSEGDIFNIEVMPLYAAPPAPVSVPNSRAITQHFDTIALQAAREIICDVNRRHEFLGGEVQLLSRIQCRIDDACRAVMLQGAENDESPTTMQTAPALDSSQIIAESPSGNSPVIPDGWVACSERMPEGMQTVITSNGFDIGQAWWDGEGWNSFDSHDVVPGEVTHWMPLPAAPLQEVK